MDKLSTATLDVKTNLGIDRRRQRIQEDMNGYKFTNNLIRRKIREVKKQEVKDEYIEI